MSIFDVHQIRKRKLEHHPSPQLQYAKEEDAWNAVTKAKQEAAAGATPRQSESTVSATTLLKSTNVGSQAIRPEEYKRWMDR